MAWVKLESRYPRHPKMVEAGAVAIALDVCGICYCREHNTDGFIPDAALPMVGPIPSPGKVALVLAGAGRWIRDDDRRGWWVHDFLEYNPSDETDAAKAAERSAKASRAARARWDARRATGHEATNAQPMLLSIAQAMPEPCDQAMLKQCPPPYPSLLTDEVNVPPTQPLGLGDESGDDASPPAALRAAFAAGNRARLGVSA